jgi:hypothetical protein
MHDFLSVACGSSLSIVFSPSESSKFKYSIGGSYQYDYEGSVQTTIFGASEGASGMRLKATADFEVIDSCDLALRVSRSRILFSADSSV